MTCNLSAEGSKELNPLGTAGDPCADPTIDVTDLTLLTLTGQASFASFGSYGTSRTLCFEIKDPNEVVYIALSGAANGAGECAGAYDWRIAGPNGFISPVNNIDNSNANGNDLGPLLIGPDAIVGAGGYSTAGAYTFMPPGVGIFCLEFDGVDNIRNFDITVANAAGVAIPGRLYSENWNLRTPCASTIISCQNDPTAIAEGNIAFQNPFNAIVYVLTDDNFVQEVNFANGVTGFGDGFRGLTFALSFNMTGPGNTGVVADDRQSKDGSDETAANPNLYRVYVNPPDPTCYEPGICGDIVTGPLLICQDPLCLEYEVTRPGLVEVFVDLDGPDGVFTPGTADVVLSARVLDATELTGCIPWDQNDGLGNMVDIDESLSIIATYVQGEIHFMQFDVENNNPGWTVNTIDPSCSTPDFLLYWDDSQLDPVDNDSGVPGQPLVSLQGAAQSAHLWEDQTDENATGFGESNTINTWFYSTVETMAMVIACEEDCPTIAPPVITVAENTCDPEADGFYEVTTECEAGLGIEFSIDGGSTWGKVLPTYPDPFITRCVEEMCLTADLSGLDASDDAVDQVNMGTVMIGSAVLDSIVQTFNGTSILDENEITTSQTTGDLGISFGVEHDCIEDICGQIANSMNNLFYFSEPICNFTIDLWDLDRDDEMVLTATGPNGPVTYTVNVLGMGVDNTGNIFSSNDPTVNYPGDGPATLGMFSVTFDDCITQISIDYYDASNTAGDGGSFTIVFQEGCTNEECISDEVAVVGDPEECPTCTPIDPVITVVDNICDPEIPGSYTIATPCGPGFNLEYSIDNGAMWSTTQPDYPAVFLIRCIDVADPMCVSSEIAVIPNPEACCVVDPIAILAPAGPACTGATVSFDASGSIGAVTSYEWDFDGDGTIDATTAVPTVAFTYPAVGTYTAFVTIIDGTGLCTSSTTSIEVIICGVNAVVCPSSPVVVVDGDPIDPVTLGEPQVTTNVCNPTFDITNVDTSVPGTCPLEEIITRIFTITDGCGETECIQIINVEIDNPAAINALPITPEICLGDVVTLDASASVGDGLTYCWNVGIGTVGCDYTTAIASHQYAAAGTYEITLLITDQYGCTDEQIVGSVIVFEGPEAIATATFDPCTLEVTYDASGSIDNAAPNDLIYTWDFGDGSTSGTASGSYIFDNCAAVGTITLTIIDPTVPFPACNSDQLTFSFTTDTEPPVLVCPDPVELNCGDPIPTYADLGEFIAAGGTATDNCDIVAFNQVSLDTIPGLCPYVHTIEVVYEAFDFCDNRTTCTQIYNLLPSLPTASFPDNVILSCGDDYSTDATGFPILVVNDCTRPTTISVSDNIISGSCPGDVTIDRTFTLLDDCGNTLDYVQTITIVNDIVPVLEGPPDITIGCLDACDPDGTGGLAVVVDYCMPIDGSTNTITLTYTDEYVGFDGTVGLGGILGYIIRTFVAVDACGNEGIYVQTISIIRDNVAAIICNDKVNVSLASDCQGITPDFLLEAPADTKYFITLEDGQFGFSLDPNETFDSIDWSIYIESGEPINYTITDICGNSCWGEVLIEANIIPDFETPCTYEPGNVLDSAGEINDQDVLDLNDMILINEDPGRTTDFLGTINLKDGSCQEAFVVGLSNFKYNAAAHGAALDIQYVDLILYFVNTEDGTLLSFPFPTGTINVAPLTDLQLNPGEYDVFVAAADYRAFGDYSLHIEVSGCLPSCTTICAGDYPEEFVTVEEINEILDEDCYSTMLGDILVEETLSGEMCDGILHVVTYTGLFRLHGELVKHELITQAYVEQPIDLDQYDIQAPRTVNLDCGADVSPDSIFAQTGSGSQAYPFYFDFDHIKIDTICLEEVVIHYDVPIDTVQEMASVNGLWVLLDIVKKERRDSIKCLRRGPNPVIQYQEIFLDDNLCNVLVDYSDIIIEACAGGQKVIRDWVIIDWCDNNAQIHLSQTIEVKDRQAPTIEKWDDVVVSVDPWSCAATYKLPIGKHTDNCNSDLLTESWHLSEGQVVDGYAIDLWLANNPIEAYLTVSDDCGNTALDTFNIIVEDRVAPVPVCETNLNVTLTSAMLAVNDGGGKVYAESFDAGSHDSGCSEITIQARRVTGCCSTQCIDQYECTATDPKTGICIDSTIVGYTTEYADFVKFCCEDVGQLIMVEILVTDQVGNSNSCTVEVTVVDKTQRILSCPPITVNCLDDMNTIADPLIAGQFCESENSTGASLLNESDISGYCGTEQLIREWYIDRNGDGEFSSGDPYCRQVVTFTSENGGMDPYTIKWPKHYTGEVVQGQNLECDADGELGTIEDAQIPMGDVQVCGVNGETYGEPIWCDAACSLVAHNMEVDTIFSSDACFKLINRWTIIDWCKWDANGSDIDDDNDSSRDQFIAIEDWAQGECAACPEEGPVYDDAVYFKYVTVEEDGYYTFDQIVKVVDDSAPSITVVTSHEVSTTGGAISKDDATSCRGDELLTATVSDFCNGVESPADLVRWNVTVQRGDYIIDIQNGLGASMTMNSGTGSPGDLHIITWSAIDGCGNVSEATTEVTFDDDVNPTPFCIAGVTTSFPDGNDSVVVWASDVDFGSYDNCTDFSELNMAIVPEGQAPLAPGSEGFDDQFGYSISCEENRTSVFVDMWVWDKSGNGDYCTTSIIVDGGCGDQSDEPDEQSGNAAFIIAGHLQTELGMPIADATVFINASIPEFPKSQVVTSGGQYSFDNNPLGFNYVMTPEKDMNHTNGVTTLDLLLIQKHILGLRDLGSPYKVIAADISNDREISSIDIVEGRRLILGYTDRFSNNNSWRFVDGQQDFIALDNPWPFTEVRQVDNLDNHAMAENFIGMKIGDVNDNAAPSESMLVETRYTSTLQLDAKISQTKSNVIEVTTQNKVDIYGMQFTLSDIKNTVVSVQSNILDINEENYYVNGETSLSWHVEDGQALHDQVVFDIVFAEELNQTHLDQLSIVTGITKAEAYLTPAFDIWDIVLNVDLSQTAHPSLSQNWPNPFNNTTKIEFKLPESSDRLTLSIHNSAGQLVWTETQSYPAGTHQIAIQAKSLGESGIYLYTINTETFTETKQMMLMD